MGSEATRPKCPECGRWMTIDGCRSNGQEGYAHAWIAVGTCVVHGEQGIDWDWLGDFDPEAVTRA